MKLLSCLFLMIALLFGSCSAKRGVKKCNGSKGVKTNMGVM